MPDIINFPNGGFEVIVAKRQDILDCINANIKDKEIMEALISKLEVTAEKYLSEGQKVSIPYIGTIRRNPGKVLDSKNKQLYRDATKVLNRKDYILLRKTTAKENEAIVRYNRVYRAQVAAIIRNHINEYRKLAENNSDSFAKISMYFKYTLTAIDNKYAFADEECYNPVEYGED